MKKILSIIPVILLLQACEERVAQFASRTDEMLAEYQQRIDAQIKDATQFYQRSAILQANEAKRVALDNLEAERAERSTELEADYSSGRKPTALYRTHLREYANRHYERTVEWLSADTDAATPFLQQLVALESDKATIDAYSKILKNLAKPRRVIDEIGEIKQFVEDTKKEFDVLLCDDLDGQVTDAAKVPDGETADAKTAREAKHATAAQLYADKKCDAVLCADLAKQITQLSTVPTKETDDAKKEREKKLAAAKKRQADKKCDTKTS